MGMCLPRSAMLLQILDNEDEVLNYQMHETNKELATWLQEVSSVMLIQFYQLLEQSITVSV